MTWKTYEPPARLRLPRWLAALHRIKHPYSSWL